MPFRALPPVAYIVYQAVGSVFVNAAINYGFIWPVRHQPAFPVWGAFGSVAFDTLLTAVLLTFLTVLSGGFFVKLDVKRGFTLPATWLGASWLRYFPLCLWKRALVFTLLFAPLGCAIGLPILLAYGVSTDFPTFALFKLTFACALGFVVTPLNAIWVMAAPSAIPR